ncbi:MAG: tyrosine--tRNA ligase [bacterium]|nr:tyrosine--tRNA ligase [bacterium]
MESIPKLKTEGIVTDPTQIENKLELIDRLINWDNSLTKRDKFKEMLLTGKQLRIKFGADITAQTLHIGHAVNLRVMRHLQDLGHKVVFLLGGFTTLVGDPTDKLMARTAPDQSEMEANKLRFIEQIKGVIRFDDENLIEIKDNIEWWGTLEKPGTIVIGHFFEMLKTLTVTSLLARDMFRKRMESDTPIYVSEFLYPILQGYDSVEIKSDMTIVGSDQMFNEKMAWGFQQAAGQEKQAILCTKITPGLDGGEKQSKSIGNYVGLAHTPKEKFNRVMLLLDELVPQWFEVYTEIEQDQINKFKEEYATDPISFKKRLAFYITELFHGTEEAEEAEKDFDSKKILKRIPAEIQESSLGESKTLDELLRKNFKQKTNSIKDLINSHALSVVTKVNNDGTYEEILINDLSQAKSYHLTGGEIVRWGKNKFYRTVV